jgi:serine/threonine-protein kinase RsbW
MHPYDGFYDRGPPPTDIALNRWAIRSWLDELADLAQPSQALENWMRVLGYPARDIFAVKLALREAAVNAFRHGNRGDPRKGVWIDYLVTWNEVVVEVTDQGPGFDPLDVKTSERMTPRGLFLMHAYMTGVSFNRPGNRVTLWKLRSQD